jgi:hypothetical protein
LPANFSSRQVRYHFHTGRHFILVTPTGTTSS